MSGIGLYNQEGTKVKDLAVDALTSGPVRKGLLYYMVRYQQAKKRAGTHASKTRGMVRGSTRKIYRQKGTGRARHGDRKANIFVGGGQVFGPNPRDYSYSMPKSARRRGLQSAIAYKSKEGDLLALESLSWSEPKTKNALKLFEKLGATSALLVLEDRNEVIEKSVRNLPGFKVLPVAGVNVYDILNHDKLIFTQAALEKVQGRLKIGAGA